MICTSVYVFTYLCARVCVSLYGVSSRWRLGCLCSTLVGCVSLCIRGSLSFCVSIFLCLSLRVFILPCLSLCVSILLCLSLCVAILLCLYLCVSILQCMSLYVSILLFSDKRTESITVFVSLHICLSRCALLHVVAGVIGVTPRCLLSSKCRPISIIPTLFDVAAHSLPFCSQQGSLRCLLPISHPPSRFAHFCLMWRIYYKRHLHVRQSETLFPNRICGEIKPRSTDQAPTRCR